MCDGKAAERAGEPEDLPVALDRSSPEMGWMGVQVTVDENGNPRASNGPGIFSLYGILHGAAGFRSRPHAVSERRWMT